MGRLWHRIRDGLGRARAPEWPAGLREQPPLDHDQQPWFVLEGDQDDVALIVRVSDAFRTDEQRRRQRPIRIGLAMPFEHGIGPLDHELLDALEDEVFRRIGDQGVLVAVLTTPHMREFVVHTADRRSATNAIAVLEVAFEPYELQSIVEEDPLWSVYFDLLSHAVDGGADGDQ